MSLPRTRAGSDIGVLPLVPLAAWAFALGCTAEPAPMPEEGGAEPLSVVRDSAGVRIVQIATDLQDLPLAYQVRQVPIADLGGPRTPDQELQSTGYRRIVRLGDGRWVVTDNDNLKFFDREGGLLHISGRRGTGPGEFRQITDLCVAAGDSLVAVDRGQRASVLDGRGSYARSFVLNRTLLANEACVGTRPWLGMTVRTDAADRSLRRVSITRLSPDGVSDETLLTLTYPEPPASTIAPNVMATSFFATPFNVAPTHDLLHVGHGFTPEIRTYDLSGSLADIVRWRHAPVALTDDRAACMIRNGMLIPPGADPLEVEQFIASRLREPRPAHASSFGGIQVDDRGRVWVQDPFLLTSGPPAWTVLDPDGQPLGRVVIPVPAGADARSVEVLSVWGSEIALGWVESDLGFRHLTLHALDPVERRAAGVGADRC